MKNPEQLFGGGGKPGGKIGMDGFVSETGGEIGIDGFCSIGGDDGLCFDVGFSGVKPEHNTIIAIYL